MHNLLEVTSEACETAVKKGAYQADAIALENTSIVVEVEKNSINFCKKIVDSGFSIRAFINGGAGFSNCMGLEKKDVRETVLNAIKLSQIAQPDLDFVSLPSPLPYPITEDVYDDAICNLTPDDAVKWVSECLEGACSVSNNIIIKAEAGFSTSRFAISNSLGINVNIQSTSAGLSVFSVVKNDDDVASYYDFFSVRRFRDIKTIPYELGRKTTEKAVSFLNAIKVETCCMPVVLSPLAAADLFRSVCSSANAESIQRGRSYLTNRRGELIASEAITVIEDPLHPGGLYSSSVDGEGYPKTKTPIIEKGILNTYLHNSYTANKAKEKNTGHAVRLGYTSRVGISPTNLKVQTGTKTESEIISEIDKGIYIDNAFISPNPITGEISATIDYGYIINKGKIEQPIINAMAGGNIFDLLKNIDAVSSDYREDPGNIMPSVRTNGLKIVGGM